jgi:hypothetical protein
MMPAFARSGGREGGAAGIRPLSGKPVQAGPRDLVAFAVSATVLIAVFGGGLHASAARDAGESSGRTPHPIS